MSNTVVPPFYVSEFFTYWHGFYLLCEFSWVFSPPFSVPMSFSFILPLLDPLILPCIMTQDVMHSCSVVCMFFELLPLVSALIYYFFLNISTVNYFLWETRENVFFPVMFSTASYYVSKMEGADIHVCCFLALLQFQKARCIFQFCSMISHVNMSRTGLGSAKVILSP